MSQKSSGAEREREGYRDRDSYREREKEREKEKGREDRHEGHHRHRHDAKPSKSRHEQHQQQQQQQPHPSPGAKKRHESPTEETSHQRHKRRSNDAEKPRREKTSSTSAAKPRTMEERKTRRHKKTKEGDAKEASRHQTGDDATASGHRSDPSRRSIRRQHRVGGTVRERRSDVANLSDGFDDDGIFHFEDTDASTTNETVKRKKWKNKRKLKIDLRVDPSDCILMPAEQAGSLELMLQIWATLFSSMTTAISFLNATMHLGQMASNETTDKWKINAIYLTLERAHQAGALLNNCR